MGKELKSTIDLIMEKLDKEEKRVSLTEEQKLGIAEIRKIYDAKIAEKKILLKGDEELEREISRLESQRDDKIEKIRSSR
jgi:hypothetical protein